jgi:hypothetical protein
VRRSSLQIPPLSSFTQRTKPCAQTKKTFFLSAFPWDEMRLWWRDFDAEYLFKCIFPNYSLLPRQPRRPIVGKSAGKKNQ